ncbi:MAG: Asp23/Gls24 family envelope stress response protein [Oscillospiraceae bacterium]|nr:Asp23/Gls24 family envelope stress response protein [Oscillospiraceae bacterium]
MAENKQYITQELENGTVMISEEVIATIVAQAVSEVEGVVGLSVKPGVDIVEMIGKKNWGKGMKIAISENDELTIDCNVNVGYGQSVVTVAKAVQEAVTNAIESTTNVKVSTINVNVCGIIRQ